MIRYTGKCPEGMGLCSRVHAPERRNVPGFDVLCKSVWQDTLFHVPTSVRHGATRCLSGTFLCATLPGTRAHVALAAPCTRLRSPMPSGHSTRLHFNISTVFCNCPLFNCSRIAIKGKLCGQSIQLIMSDALAAHYVGN